MNKINRDISWMKKIDIAQAYVAARFALQNN